MILFEITEEAANNIREIRDYISNDNPERARSFLRKMLLSAEGLLTIAPLSCPIHNETSGIRKYAYQRYNIYYKFHENEKMIRVTNIVHSSKILNEKLRYTIL